MRRRDSLKEAAALAVRVSSSRQRSEDLTVHRKEDWRKYMVYARRKNTKRKKDMPFFSHPRRVEESERPLIRVSPARSRRPLSRQALPLPSKAHDPKGVHRRQRFRFSRVRPAQSEALRSGCLPRENQRVADCEFGNLLQQQQTRLFLESRHLESALRVLPSATQRKKA